MWKVSEVNRIGVKTLYQVHNEETGETAGGHYESIRIAQLLADTLNKEGHDEKLGH